MGVYPTSQIEATFSLDLLALVKMPFFDPKEGRVLTLLQIKQENMIKKGVVEQGKEVAYLEDKDLNDHQIRRKRLIEDLFDVLDWGVTLRGVTEVLRYEAARYFADDQSIRFGEDVLRSEEAYFLDKVIHELAHHQEFLKLGDRYRGCRESHQKNGMFSEMYRFVASQLAIIYTFLYEKNMNDHDVSLDAVRRTYEEVLISSKVLMAA